MLRVKLAQNTGFCTGVKRAIDIVENTLAKGNHKVYSLGPVIHNLEVIKQLEKKNLRIVNSLDNLEEASTVILPSHGSPRRILNIAKRKKLRLIDVTCPYVSSVHKICNRLYKEGFKVVIIGDKKHPEIMALVDLAPGSYVIQNLKDIPKNKFSRQKIGIIAQTTQARDMFFEIVNKILQKNPEMKEVRIFNTICLDTARRQEEIKRLASCVDILLVVGSRISANTRRLLCIGRKFNKRSYIVQTKDEPIHKLLKNAKVAGIISGASTPNWLVKQIIQKILPR